MIGTGTPGAAFLIFAIFASAGSAAAPRSAAPRSADPPAGTAPALRADTAVYNLEQGVLQYGFTFANPSDSVLFLDCQVPPRASLSGTTLVLEFDRQALPSKDGGSGEAPAAGSEGARAGGPVAAAVDANDFPPQRIGARQTFQGQRRLDRVLGDYQARPKFSALQLRMAYYPERDSGEGESFVAERRAQVTSKVLAVARRGKPPAPPKVIRHRVPAPG